MKEAQQPFPNVFVHTTITYNPIEYEYVVECIGNQALKITLDFSKSRNILAVPSAEISLQNTSMTITSLVPAFSRVTFGKVVLSNPKNSFQVKLQCLMETEQKESSVSKLTDTRDPYVITLMNLKVKRTLEIEEQLINTKGIVFTEPEVGSDSVYVSLENFHSQIDEIFGGRLFIDRAFPPTDETIYTSLKDPSALEKVKAGENLELNDIVLWKRAKEIFDPEGRGGPDTQFAVFLASRGEQDIDPNDIEQGSLGNCWFLCALASLAEFPPLVKSLFPVIDCKEKGIYLVSLFSEGRERLVAVDDYFPCRPNGGPVFSRAHGNELWVLLIEKAYAKLKGSYYSLKGGFAFEAYLDLLGCPYKVFNLEKFKTDLEQETLWQDLALYDSLNYVLSAGTFGEDKYTLDKESFHGGLVGGHAYTILTVKQGSGGQRLMKLRNPWGETEWEGDWSDKSSLWTKELKEEFHLLDCNDGTFWMAYSDFLANFARVNVSLARHDAPGKLPWTVHRSPFRFKSELTESGARSLTSEAFLFTLNGEEGQGWDTYLSLHQKDSRDVRAVPPYLSLGMAVYQVQAIEGSPLFGVKFLEIIKNSLYPRQNQLELLSLPPGSYLVVPLTPACFPSSEACPGSDCEREVTMVLHTECPTTTWTDLCPIGGAILDELLALACESRGTVLSRYKESSVEVLYHFKESFAFSVRNTRSSPVLVEMDITGTKGYASNRSGNMYSVRVEPGQSRLLHDMTLTSFEGPKLEYNFKYNSFDSYLSRLFPCVYMSPFQLIRSPTSESIPSLSLDQTQSLITALTVPRSPPPLPPLPPTPILPTPFTPSKDGPSRRSNIPLPDETRPSPSPSLTGSRPQFSSLIFVIDVVSWVRSGFKKRLRLESMAVLAGGVVLGWMLFGSSGKGRIKGGSI